MTTNDNEDDEIEIRRVRYELDRMGVDLFEPQSKKELAVADALEAFAAFVLYDGKDQCQSIIERHLVSGSSDESGVGELQGGNDEQSIYRIVIVHEDNHRPGAVANELLSEFLANHNHGRRYASALTMEKVQQYLLGMCHRRSQKRRHRATYNKLGNLMFILSFGTTHGQVRHIDRMDPNLQVCCYISNHCPTTIVYKLRNSNPETTITNAQQLIDYWETKKEEEIITNDEIAIPGQEKEDGNNKDLDSPSTAVVVPDLVKKVLLEYGNVDLKSKPYTKYFASLWAGGGNSAATTINSHLKTFGKLYLPVEETMALLNVEPGTTLIAGGNEVHAGPPTTGPRMFVFAIGIPDEETTRRDDGDDNDSNLGEYDHDECNGDEFDNGAAVSQEEKHNENNNGEVQYNTVMLHLDLCCVLFSFVEFEQLATTTEDDEEEKSKAKGFLLNYLVPLCEEYPNETYARLIGDDRSELRAWIGKLVIAACGSSKEVRKTAIRRLIDEAVESDTMFYSPDVVSGDANSKVMRKMMKKRAAKNKKQQRTKAAQAVN